MREMTPEEKELSKQIDELFEEMIEESKKPYVPNPREVSYYHFEAGRKGLKSYSKPTWNVFEVSYNDIVVNNVFDHGSLYNELVKLNKEHKKLKNRYVKNLKANISDEQQREMQLQSIEEDLKQDFAEKLRSNLFYYFCSKSEHEIYISDVPRLNKEKQKQFVDKYLEAYKEEYIPSLEDADIDYLRDYLKMRVNHYSSYTYNEIDIMSNETVYNLYKHELEIDKSVKQTYCAYVDIDTCEKVDVYTQVMLNWQQFVDYTWEHLEDFKKYK